MIRSALALAFAAPLSVAPVAAAPATATQLPVVGAVSGGGTFAGTLTNAAGQTVSVLQTVSMPVTTVTGTCNILHLDIGPIALDLLDLLNDPNGLARLLNQILAAL